MVFKNDLLIFKSLKKKFSIVKFILFDKELVVNFYKFN